jgi:arylsulfatase A-like enzyme
MGAKEFIGMQTTKLSYVKGVLGIVVTLVAALALRVSGVAAAERPNIVFILADDLGYGDLSCYGQKNFATPHLDRMAAEGLRFTQHYAGSTVCAPSRACLLTGLHTGHSWQRANGGPGMRPDPQDVTVARLLKSAGYQTALIGKSPFIKDDRGRRPNAKGFDHFFGYSSHTAAHRYYPEFLWRNGEQVLYPENHGFEGTHYSSDMFAEDALDWLDKHADKPFFLHLCLQQPHADLSVPVKWKQPLLGKFDESPAEGGRYRDEPHPKSTFAGMVTHLDDVVRQVRRKLEELGCAENTLVLFSSDNGAMNEGGWDREFFDSNGPLRGGKRDLYEGGVRTPLIAWWPTAISPGRTTEHISAFWDFLPTACELAGVEPPENLDGLSYAPTLLGQGKQPAHDYLYWEFYEQGGKQAVRQGQWKAVRLDFQKNPAGPLELYHLPSDVGETKNVAAEHPEIVARMEQLMREAHTDSGEFTIAER